MEDKQIDQLNFEPRELVKKYENSEKISTLFNGNYMRDEQFLNIYQNLAGAYNNEQDLLSAFQMDCTIMVSQIPSVDPSITMKI